MTLILTPRGLRLGQHIFPCAIGRGGLSATKHEGDGATPRGTHNIVGLMYRPDRMAQPAPWAEPIGPGDLWCDDPAHPEYNHHVTAPFSASHERLRRSDSLYDLVLVTDWNWPNATPGKGSAIFVHQWRKPHHPTEGCIALSRAHLAHIARNAPPGTRLIIP